MNQSMKLWGVLNVEFLEAGFFQKLKKENIFRNPLKLEKQKKMRRKEKQKNKPQKEKQKREGINFQKI